MGDDIDDINRGYAMIGVVPFTRPEDYRRHALARVVSATQELRAEAQAYHEAQARAPAEGEPLDLP